MTIAHMTFGSDDNSSHDLWLMTIAHMTFGSDDNSSHDLWLR